MRRAILALDLLLIFLFAAVLIHPLFQAKYLNRWDSIESTFIADGRYLHGHLPHPEWQPLWYCGTRYDYLYPPVVRYGTALLSGAFAPVQAYHVFTALVYCCGICGVYLFAWVAGRSRWAAWLAAAASALVSPVYLAIPWRAPYLPPWHLWILLGNGEGPHVCSVALLPFALACTWLALERRQAGFIAAAGTGCALVALTNFYGAAALAILYPVLVWSLWVTHRSRRLWLRAIAIAALAYGLAAFWLTPSYLRITLRNLQLVSPPGNAWSAALLAGAAVLYGWLSFATAGRKPRRAYLVFLSGSLWFMGLNVIGYFYFQFRVVGQPHRLISELDLAMILAGAELLRRLWIWPGRGLAQARLARGLAAAIVLLALWQARHYVRHAWGLYPRETNYRQRVEYRMSEWMAGHLPEARTFVTGSVRFWWDTWRDLAQVGGGSDQGVLNTKVFPAQWEIMLGNDPESAVRWLTALGADAVIVSDRRSQEIYHDFKFPDKFRGVLPVLYYDGAGNVIYRVPRRYASLARVVDRTQFARLRPLEQSNLELLRAYTAAIEEGPDSRATTAWDGSGELRVHARMAAGQAILVQETYDPGWHAYADGRELPVRRDVGADFSVIDAPAGEQDVRFVFETPWENRIGWVVTWLSLGMAGVLATGGLRGRRRLQARPT